MNTGNRAGEVGIPTSVRPLDEDVARLYGSAGDGLRWALRRSRPLHHREDCDCSLCWKKVAVDA